MMQEAEQHNHSDVIVYLYRSLLQRNMMDEETTKNEYLSTNYCEVIQGVTDFVLSNIQQLVVLKQNQTSYKKVFSSANKKKKTSYVGSRKSSRGV